MRSGLLSAVVAILARLGVVTVASSNPRALKLTLFDALVPTAWRKSNAVGNVRQSGSARSRGR